MHHTTARLRLRPLVAEDDAFILELLNEPAWHQFIGDRGVRTLDAARAYIGHGPVAMYARCGFGLLAVERQSDRMPLGICGLIQRDSLADIDLGFAFLARHWGQGYAYEAASVVLDHAHTTLGRKRIVALTALENPASIRLLGKLGFRFDRLLRLPEHRVDSRFFVHEVDNAPGVSGVVG